MEQRTAGSRWATAIAWVTASFVCPLAVAQVPKPGVAPKPPAVVQVQGRRGVRGNLRNPAPDGRTEDDLALDGVFLPPDRTAKRRLDLSQEMLEDRRFGEAVRLLGALLEGSEDFFFKPNAEQPVYRSLKAEAGRLIAMLPAEGRESYELQFGARARQMLKQATAAGNLADVAEVSRRFFFTQAGQEATFLIGRHHLDQNRPLAAALCFERLVETSSASGRLEPTLSLNLATCWLRAGKPEKAKAVLVQLKRGHGAGKLLMAGKPVKLFSSDAQALAWMDETFGPQRAAHQAEVDAWAMYRGDEARNAASAGGRPLLSLRWRQRTTDDRAVEKFVAKTRSDYLAQEIAALPSMHPLAIGDVVVMRTAFAIEAVDFQNGKLVWRYPVTDDSPEQFAKAGGSQQPTANTQQLFAGLDQRMWEDAVYGTLSSDGGQVYYVEDLGLAGVNSNMLMTVLPNGQRRYSVNSRGTNRLAARELRTQGKLKWEVGGVTGEDEPKLAGAFFLGPPLPLLGRLYALAEMKGQEIRLVVLSPRTGALEWSQQLAVVDPPVTADGFRRNAGAVPSFADGVLVCPTTAGAVVGIDLTSRSLLWGYQYPRVQSYATERFVNGRLTVYPGTERRMNERWSDSSVTIADGRALVTPVETDQLYCLNLTDGKELWKQNRANHLYVGCVHHDNVILVGRNSVSSVRLANGESAWPEAKLPAGSLPSGRGFYSGDFYYLPLTSAEVAKIDLQTGKIEARARSRGGTIPGNLICYRGSVISQGVDAVDAYFQLEALKDQVAKTLAERPDDPAALASLAQVKLDEGKLSDAVQLFRRSYQAKSDEGTREQLVESMLEALRVDFAGNRDRLAELDALVEQPRHRVDFLRLQAQGLRAAGELLPAFETTMKLVDSQAPLTLDAVDDQLIVRRDRWIRAQLEQLRAQAPSETRQRIDAVVGGRMKAALEDPSVDGLRSFLTVFGSYPAADAVREALVTRLGEDDLLERDLLLRKFERSADTAQVAATSARLAQMLRAAGRADLAAIYYRQLARRFADTVCVNGKTGQQIVDELAADDPLRKAIDFDRAWPLGNVKVRDDRSPARTGVMSPRMPRAIDLETVGPTSPLFEDVSVSYDQQQHLIAQDGLGEKRFRIPLFEQGGRRLPSINRNAYNAPALNYVSVNGGLLLLLLGNQVVAVDMLRAGDSSSSRVLWNQDLSDQIAGFPSSQGIASRPVNLPWGGARYVPEDAFGRRLGSIGPVNDDGVYFQRLHDLYCVDPLSGKTIWMRKNVGAGHDLFGDDELLFVAPPGDGDTTVLRATTGESLGVRRIPPFERRMTTLGRRVLSWETQGQQVLVQLRDAWDDKTVWSFTFAPGSKAALVGQEAVGVFHPGGEFTLITLADGKAVVQEKLEPENPLLGIFLLRSREGYLLVTNTVARNEPNMSVTPIPMAPNSPLVTGRIYAFERGTGKKLWPAPVAIAQQGLLLSQPADLPALILVRQVHRLGPSNTRDPKIAVQCIDKRSGRVFYTNDQLPGTTIANFELSGDAAAHTVTLTLPSRVIAMTFTDEPIAASPAAGQAGAPAAAPEPAEAPGPSDPEPAPEKTNRGEKTTQSQF